MMETQNQNQTDNTKHFGAPSTSRALFELFETAADHLTHDQLAYLSRMNELAVLQSQSLSETCNLLASFYCDTENLNAPMAESTAEILWGVSLRLDHIGGLIKLAKSAAYRLDNPRTAANKSSQNQRA